ncbi:MAG: hypothetical protein KTR21_16975, partial [Rhodobacteraceae bacterium]|nr:hypothetical protein [Paracoccaceae bacterium]
ASMTVFDVVFCLDLRQEPAEAETLGAVIDALAARSARVGLSPVLSATRPAQPWAAALQARLRAGAATLVDPGATASARVAAIPDVGAVLAPPSPAPRLRADRTVLRAGAAVAAAFDQLDPHRLASNARDLTGGALMAAPATEQARARLAGWAPLWPLTRWDWTEDSGDAAQMAARLLSLADETPAPPASPLPLAPERPRKRHVLFLSPNGVGLGHLTRLLAIARRLPPSIEPVFLTMSYAARVAEAYGFLTEFTPRVADAAWWIEGLRAHLREMTSFYDFQAVVCDLNVPYAGLLRARKDMPGVPFIWVRRGMWREHHGDDVAERESNFDLIIEPRDYADDYDRGVTIGRPGPVRRTGPITLLDPKELLSRETARADLSLSPEGVCGLIMLGSGSNFDMASVEMRVCGLLRDRIDVDYRVLRWTIALNGAGGAGNTGSQAWRREGGGRRRPVAELAGLRAESAREISIFPAARYFNGFDFAVSAVGYNSFHELLSVGPPTAFVPNENPMMDDQIGRSSFAARRGYALQLRHSDLYRTEETMAQLLDPAERARLSAARTQLPAADGAAEAAQILMELIGGVRALHPVDSFWRG